MLGDRTRSRGPPLPDAIVWQPAANFIRNHFHIGTPTPLRNRSSRRSNCSLARLLQCCAGEGGNPFALLECCPDFPLPLQPHPPKSAVIHRPVVITRLLKSIPQNLSG